MSNYILSEFFRETTKKIPKPLRTFKNQMKKQTIQ